MKNRGRSYRPFYAIFVVHFFVFWFLENKVDSFLIWNHRLPRKSVYAFYNNLLTQTHRQTNLKMGLLDGIKSFVNRGKAEENTLIISSDQYLATYTQKVASINSFESSLENLTDDQLKAKTLEFKTRISNGESLDSLLPEAFAVVREASWRVLELRHYDVQLIGGMALHDGRLSEMATGEGKTLVALLPAYLNALTGTSTFVVTSNDYLAKRDGRKMGNVFRFLGMSVGIIQSQFQEQERRDAYECDITYLSNQELGFDFLRDNLALTPENIVQTRPFGFCIVDEADSILIDEARTPLIISKKGFGPINKYISASQIVKNLLKGKHYEVNLKDQSVELLPDGYRYCEKIVGKSLFELSDPWAFFIVNAIKAKELFQLNQQYITQNGEIVIVDSFSGRVLTGRRFTDGLHQALEAKEGLTISGESQVVAKVTYQNLFKLFPKLSGMTGTAATDAVELYDVYNLIIVSIPTALPVARRDNPDAVFRTKAGKMKAMLKNVMNFHEKGRPILIGTTSIESSDEIMQALQDLGLNPKLLNARPENAELESDIVAQAGRMGSITVATNMAGRGTDILIGGSPLDIARSLIKYYLLIKANLLPAFPDKYNSNISTNMMLTQISEFLQSSLPSAASDKTTSLLESAALRCLGSLQQANDPISRYRIESMINQALDFEIPVADDLIELRDAINSLAEDFIDSLRVEREQVLKLGGLYVVGTARHESRRIDNQLRGRSGRQGDPGSSRFFLSLEDDLFKTFGAEKLSGIMENFRVSEEIPIENEMVAQALDRVQTQIEEFQRSRRMQLYRIDEVVSNQRTSIYLQRKKILFEPAEEIVKYLENYSLKTMEEIISANSDVEKAVMKLKQFFPNIEINGLDIGEVKKGANERLQKSLFDALGMKEKELQEASSWSFPALVRYLVLVQIDETWSKHLNRLNLLQEEMLLQSFTAERDLVEKFREGANQAFLSIMDEVRRNTVFSLFTYKVNKT